MADLNLLTSAREKFISQLKKNGRSSSTIVAYGKDLAQLIDFLAKKQITQATSVLLEHLEAFKQEFEKNKYTPKSISRKLNSIRTFFHFLHAQKIISENPALLVSHPKLEIKPPRILSKMEYRALRDAARSDIRIAAIVELLLQTGMRISEVSRLELDDFTDDQIRIRPYESQEGRTVALNQAAKKALNAYLDLRQKAKIKAIFITKTLKPIHVRNIRSAINRYFRLAGIKNATVNDLRHTFIVHQLTSGVSVLLLQKLIGHKRLASTEKYLELIKTQTLTGEKVEEL